MLTCSNTPARLLFHRFSHLAPSTRTQIWSASCRRKVKLYPRTLISTGSPIGAKRTNSTGVPTSRPISMRRGRLAGGSLISATVAVEPRLTDVRGCVAAAMGSGHFLQGRLQRGDQDGFGQFRADAEARVADETDEIAFPA